MASCENCTALHERVKGAEDQIHAIKKENKQTKEIQESQGKDLKKVLFYSQGILFFLAGIVFFIVAVNLGWLPAIKLALSTIKAVA